MAEGMHGFMYFDHNQPQGKPVARKKSRNKHGNVRTQKDGHQFDSIVESKYYQKLKQMQLQGRIRSFTMQQDFTVIDAFEKNGVKYSAIKYRADFVVVYPDGEIVIVDVKGQEKVTDVFALKFKLFHLRYPHRFLIVRYDYKNKRFIEKETLS